MVFHHCSNRLSDVQSVCRLSVPLFVFYSLAVHPDKITIATGQVPGTSSEGKVSDLSSSHNFESMNSSRI